LFGVLYEHPHEHEHQLHQAILLLEVADEHEQMDECYGYQLEIL